MYWYFNGANRYIDKKSFSNVHFTMTLPQATLFDTRIEFDYSYKFKQGEDKTDSLLIGAKVTDVFKQEVTGECSALLKQSGSPKVNACVEYPKKPSLHQAYVDFLYLCSNGVKVKVSYYFERRHIAELVQIERCDMTEDEKNKYFEIVSSLAKRNEKKVEDSQQREAEDYHRTDWELPPSLDEYVNALKRETQYLKNRGGTKHKITNGTRLSVGKEGYSYLFEMEAELYLPDDTPISLETNAAIHAVGSVLHCEDFQILIIVDKDLGERVFYSYVSVEPWKLLVAQEECIRAINPYHHKIAVKLIKEGPVVATKQAIDMIDKGQKAAKRKVLDSDITVVWGPPGTGKTHVMSEIQLRLFSLC